jgi:hypothetical protein
MMNPLYLKEGHSHKYKRLFYPPEPDFFLAGSCLCRVDPFLDQRMFQSVLSQFFTNLPCLACKDYAFRVDVDFQFILPQIKYDKMYEQIIGLELE